jgi:hypothetical protein
VERPAGGRCPLTQGTGSSVISPARGCLAGIVPSCVDERSEGEDLPAPGVEAISRDTGLTVEWWPRRSGTAFLEKHILY